MTDGPCAVVAGAELNGLGVVRSLARGGVPTIVLDTTYGRAAMWSRFARPVIVEKLYGRKLVDGLWLCNAASTIGLRCCWPTKWLSTRCRCTATN